MCGIAGFSGQSDFNLLKKMLKQIKHRGPDDQGDYSDNQVSLGMTRLAINDLRPGLYPLSSKDGQILLVFNGEIYNYLELRDRLKKGRVKLRTSCDAEVILPLYQKYGNDLVEHLEGMYAFALYDKKRKKLFLVRDRFGEKPLFYTFKRKQLLFASEVSALLAHPLVSKKIDLQALYYFLRFGFVPINHSIFSDIHKLAPASWLEFDLKNYKIKTKKYWDLNFGRPNHQKREEEWEEGLEDCLLSSIKQQLNIDVSAGVFLSGGVDSGIVAAMSKKIGANLPLFSVAISKDDYDESKKSEELARYLNLKYFKISFSSADLLKTLEEATGFFDEPLSDPAALPTFAMARFAKRRVKVVLTGDGADELFAGYDHYFNHLKQQRWSRWTPPFLEWFNFYRKINFPYNWLTWFTHLKTHYLPQQVFTQRKTIRLFDKEARKKISLNDPFMDYKKKYSDKPLSLMLYTDIKSLLANQFLTKADKMTMAWGLEARAPFLSREVATYAAKIPSRFKIKTANQEKFILRKLANRYLPSNLAWQKKQGFRLPLDDWLRGPLAFMLGELIIWAEEGELPLNEQMVKNLVEEHRQGKNHGSRLWVLLSLKYWQQNLK